MGTTNIIKMVAKGSGGIVPYTPPPPPFDLLTYPGLQAYYDMTDPANVVVTSGKATQLTDLSTHGRNMTEQFDISIAYPAYTPSGGIGGGGFITLSNNGAMLKSATGISGRISAYAVVRFKNFTRTVVSGQGVVKTAIAFGARDTGLICDDVATTGHYVPKVQASGVAHQDLNEAMKTTSWQIVNMDFTGRTAVRLNNQPNGLTYSVDLGAIGAGQIWLGYYTLPTDVEIAALVIVNGTISTADENNIYAWLDARYPVTKKQFFEVCGDSISTGNGDTQTIWPFLVSSAKGYDLVSHSQGGTIGFANGNGSAGVPGSNFVDKAPQSFTRPYAGQWLVIAYGTNDANQVTIDASWKAGYKALIQSYISFGYDSSKMILVKAPTTTARQSTMSQVFTYIGQIASELGLTVYDANARFAANGGDTLFGDTLHPNTAGNIVYADGINLIIT